MNHHCLCCKIELKNVFPKTQFCSNCAIYLKAMNHRLYYLEKRVKEYKDKNHIKKVFTDKEVKLLNGNSKRYKV
jgi:hypothetical protein